MTDQEIDKWVEEHVTAPEDSDIRPAVVEWGKIIAHKFYDLGRQNIAEKKEESELPRYYGD